MKTTYKGLKVGDKIKTVVPTRDYHVPIPVGTVFTIKDFPPSVCSGYGDYFVYAVKEGISEGINGGISLRAHTNEIIKVN